MAKPFLFRCPKTGLNVQGLAEREGEAANAIVAQSCLACGGVHLVDPRSGKLIARATQKTPARDP